MELVVILNNAIRKTGIKYTVTDGGLSFINELHFLNGKLHVAGRVTYTVESQHAAFFNNSINVHELGGTKVGTIFLIFVNYIRLFIDLVKILKKCSFVYLYAPSNLCLFFSFINVFFSRNYAIYLRGDFVSSRLFGKYRNIKVIRVLYERLLRNAAFVVVTGYSLEKKSRGFNDQVYQVVPMMTFGLKDVVKKSIGKDFNKILFVGRIDKEKGIEELLFAMKNILNVNKDAFLRVVGDGNTSYVNSLKDIIQDMGLSNNIEFVGYISNENTMRDHYLWADLFVLPSYHEGFPRVVYEAMIFQLPIIMTKIEAINYFLIDRYNALLVEVRDTESIVFAYEEFFHNIELRQFCVNNASVLIENKLGDVKFESHASQFKFLYETPSFKGNDRTV